MRQGWDSQISAQQRLQVTATSNHMQNQHVFAIDPVENHVLTNREASQSWAQIRITSAANIRDS